MSTQTVQRKKSKKSYLDLLQEAREMASKTAAVFIPQMAEALREENPDWTNAQIQQKIFLDCSDMWVEGTIYARLPSWIHNQKHVAAAKKRWEQRHKDDQEILNKKFKILSEVPYKEPELPIQNWKKEYGSSDEEDSDSDKDYDLGEPMLESYGDNLQSPLTIYGKINGPMNELFYALTKKQLPTSPEIDLIIEYLKPSREYRKGVFYEIEKDMRIYMYNAMVYTRDALNDTLHLLDEIDKREGKLNE